MNDGKDKVTGARRIGLGDAACIVTPLLFASILLTLGRGVSGISALDVVGLVPTMWGAGGYSVAIAVLLLPIAILASPLGERDEQARRR